jgi:hypothetical protein
MLFLFYHKVASHQNIDIGAQKALNRVVDVINNWLALYIKRRIQ